MSVKRDIEELQKINNDITRMYKSIRQLRLAKADIEGRISQYLDQKDIPGIEDTNKGIIVRLLTKTKTPVICSKQKRDAAAVSILQEAGVSNAEDVFEKIKGVGRKSVDKKVLVVDKIN
jgi:rhodanese-related sulfurtransferase